MTLRLPQSRRRVTIDVSFAIVNIVLLLIFFFLISGRIGAGLPAEIDPARSGHLPLERLPHPLLIVDERGWTLDGTAVSPELIGVALDALPQPVTLHLLIDRGAPAQTLVELLNRPELAGRALRLVTLHERVAP